MSFDTRCFDLAEHFLPTQARHELKDELAQAIQTRIEDWLEFEAKERCKALGIDPAHLVQP
jgi:hypothetical protein